MSEGLILGAVRKDELADAAESINAQLQKTARSLAENARLLDLTKDAIIVRGFDDRITSWNKGAEKLYGWTSDEVIGEDLHSFLNTEFPKPREEIVAQLYREGDFTGEVVQIARDGRRVCSLCRWVLDIDTQSILTTYTDITARKQAEQALRESEERYRHLFNSMDEGYCIIEMIFDEQDKAVDWRFVEVNPSFEVQSGLRGCIGRRVREFYPDHEEYWFETYGRVALTGEPVRFVNQAKSMAGRWFDLYAFRVGGADSHRVAVIFTDISNRTKIEEELKEKARLLDLTHDAIIVRGIQGEIRYWNRGAELLYGWPSEEALGQISNVLLNTKCPVSSEVMLEELHRTNHWVGELVHTKRDGQSITVLVRKTLDRDAEGNPVAVLQTLTDISERKRVEEEMRQSEERSRTLFASAPMAVFVCDRDGVIQQYNDRAAELWGRRPEPGFEKHCGSVNLWLPDGTLLPHSQSPIIGVLRTGVPASNVEVFIERPDGSHVPVLVNFAPLKNANGETTGAITSFMDITERHELEAELVARATHLSHADRSKDEFLAMLAHELRNPLAPLRNSAEILQTSEATAPEHRQALHIIIRQIENMARMIDDLLDVSRITEGKIELRKQPVALESVLTAATSLVRSGCAARHQKLAVSMPANPVYLNADATRLEQVFTNLLGNACKYSGHGCHISLSAERDHGVEPPEVIVRVRDDGAGIDPELLPRVFDLFVQETRALDRAHGGLGIGLTLVKRLVKLHGGSVEAHSEGLGHGSEFTVHLPILREPPPPPAPPPPVALEASRRILIVDDNTDSARSMAILQTRRSHVTRVAFNGPDALAVAAEFLPEVVLLDIGLPGMDGHEVARRLRLISGLSGVLLIAMTGYASPEDLMAAKQAGFDEHLVKPVDLEALRDLLRRQVSDRM